MMNDHVQKTDSYLFLSTMATKLYQGFPTVVSSLVRDARVPLQTVRSGASCFLQVIDQDEWAFVTPTMLPAYQLCKSVSFLPPPLPSHFWSRSMAFISWYAGTCLGPNCYIHYWSELWEMFANNVDKVTQEKHEVKKTIAWLKKHKWFFLFKFCCLKYLKLSFWLSTSVAISNYFIYLFSLN